MKPCRVWVIQDRRGAIWRFVCGKPVIYSVRREAKVDADALDPKRGWKPARASLTVGACASE